MKNKVRIEQVKNTLPFYMILLMSVMALMTACSSDDSIINPFGNNGNGGGNNDDYPNSYARFTILGPITEGDFEYEDMSEDDAFNATGILYTTAEDPDLNENQIQLYLGKSFSESNILMVLPPEIGSHSFSYQGGANDFNIDIKLISPDDNFYVKDLSVNISELEISGNIVMHCKGTFSGQFYRDNLLESDVHQINGAFDINQ